MLPLERRIVLSLLPDTGAERRERIVGFVDDALAAMPEHLRAGIAGVTVGIGTWSALSRAAGAGRDDAALLRWAEHHRLDPIRQWVRALRSLVLFAEHELADQAAA